MKLNKHIDNTYVLYTYICMIIYVYTMCILLIIHNILPNIYQYMQSMYLTCWSQIQSPLQGSWEEFLAPSWA